MAEITDFVPAKEVSRFFRKEREKTTRLLIRNYGVTMEKAEEAFQNGCLALFDNMSAGKLAKETLQHSLSTYLTECCRRQLLKTFPQNMPKSKAPETVVDIDSETLREELMDLFLNAGEKAKEMEQRDEDYELMERIVRDLPSPCNELIFGRYYGHEPMEEMAAMYGIKNTNTAKQTLHRCIQKLRKRFFEEREA